MLSGPVASGKSTLSVNLINKYGAVPIKTRDLILERAPNTRQERAALQRAGDALDKVDGGAWVQEALARIVEREREKVGNTERVFVVDSVRIPGQIDGIRKAFPAYVHHIHLTADANELAARYIARSSKTKELNHMTK